MPNNQITHYRAQTLARQFGVTAATVYHALKRGYQLYNSDLGRAIRREASAFRSAYERQNQLREFREASPEPTEETADDPSDNTEHSDRLNNSMANEQYVAIVRNQRSKFGKRKKYGLKSLQREAHLNDFVMKSRFHGFGTDSFQNAVGAYECGYREPLNAETQVGLCPFWLFDVTSLPLAQEGRVGGVNNARAPVRAHQLGFSTTNAAKKEYTQFGWIPKTKSNLSPAAQYTTTTALDNASIAVVTECSGYHPNTQLFGDRVARAPAANGFQHDWSDIQMVLYPPTTLPVTWHIALVSFPDSITEGTDAGNAGPPQVVMSDVGTWFPYGTGYYQNRSGTVEDYKNLDAKWQAFWSGKLKNPINRDTTMLNTTNPTSNSAPFKIIKHESFYQPARDNPDFGGTAQRLIKKLFYRRDWQFHMQRLWDQNNNGDAMANMDKIQLQGDSTIAAANSSPFPTPSGTVYLAVWTECFKTYQTIKSFDDHTTDFGTATTDVPSFDLVVRMKHTMREVNQANPIGPAPTAPLTPIPP